MKKATPEQAVAATTVFWDIKSCPVPLGFDARQVGPSIKRFLKNLGYSGPLTIKASGILTNVPGDILRAVSSTGIVLNHVSRGTEDIESLLYVWGMENISLANVMVISTPPNCSHVLKSLSKWGLNVIYPFPYEEEETADVGSLWSLWINSLLMAAPEELEEDKCRETGESSDLWVCSVCHDYEDRGFENFISHLSCLGHRVMLSLGFSRVSFEGRGSYPVKPSPKATPGDDVAETSVFWDITRCPVPPGFDARQVGPLIKRFLKNLGYSGPLTITAVGILTHVPEDILQAVSSTGILLNHVSCLSEDIEELLSRCSMKDKSPAAANVMVITTPPSYSSILSTLSQRGLNVIHPFPYEEEEEDEEEEEEEEEETADLGSLWIYSLMADSEEPEEDKCRETGDSSALWVCSECRVHEGRIQGFEKLISYLSGPEQRLETWVFWDINRCPVPLGFDARQVGPSIKRFLKNLGYSGPLAIIAVGILTHVPEDILRAVSSTGIVLYHVPRGTEDIESLLSRCSMKDKSPAVANVMVITTTPSYSSILFTLSQRGLNVIYPFPGSLWSSAPEELEEDKCRETGESSDLWVCSVCHDVEGRGFEIFISHLSGREYRVMLPLWFPEPQGPFHSYSDNASRKAKAKKPGAQKRRAKKGKAKATTST